VLRTHLILQNLSAVNYEDLPKLPVLFLNIQIIGRSLLLEILSEIKGNEE
jgi:hypothetical protein